MKISILSALFFLFVLNAVAQSEGKISGTVLQNTKPAEGATVSLLRAKDSVAVKISAAGKDGGYVFENIADGKYLLSITAAGHQKTFTKAFELSPQQRVLQVPATILLPANNTLMDVTVTAKRALIEQRIDRTIVNVDASITNLGTSAMEVLEKSPGITVDRDGNISLKGKQGVMVMVDGRPTQLGGADLANLLRNMSSSQLDQIEIMTNPPARYDAAGTSGIINIKTKKISTVGLNGSISVAYTQGRYPKTNEGFNFNYRAGKFNLFSNLSHNYQKRFSTLTINRNIFNSDTTSIDKIFHQEANRFGTGNSYSANVGVDFFASKKTTFGAAVNLSSRNQSSSDPTTTNILNAASTPESVTKALVNSDAEWNSISTNLNFRRSLDNKGREITSDLDFVKHRAEYNLFMVNSYTDPMGTPYSKADTLTGLLPQNIDIYTARVDYVQPLKKNGKFEAGIKSGLLSSTVGSEAWNSRDLKSRPH